MLYCSASDLYAFGLPRGALANPGRIVEGVDISADAFELDAHGFNTDDQIQFRVAGGSALPSPLSPATTYYAIPLDAWRFSVAAIPGGVAINITTAGDTFIAIAPLPVDAVIEKHSRLIDEMLPANVVPLSAPIPDVIRITCAELVAAELLARSGGKSASLAALYDDARKRVDRWARGVALRGDGVESAQLAQSSDAIAATFASPWRRYGGTL